MNAGVATWAMMISLAMMTIPLDAAPLGDYEQFCETPYYDHLASVEHPGADEEAALLDEAEAIAGTTCSAFKERLLSVAHPTLEQRLALLKARTWLGDYLEEEICAEVRAIAGSFPEDHPELLYQLAHCVDESPESEELAKQILLLRKALGIDPRHRSSLRFLTMLLEGADDHAMVNAATLAGYREALYEVVRHSDKKIAAAMRIFEAAIAAGDRDAAVAIRERVRSDLELDSLDYGAARRAGSLDRVCDMALFAMDLEELCLAAVEALASAAADAGMSIPDDVLGQVPYAVELLQSRRWSTGQKIPAAQRLQAVLDAHPERLKSSEHHRAYAAAFLSGSDRIAALRHAAYLDDDNLGAQCDLAEALLLDGAASEARSLYMNMAPLADDVQAPCNPELELQRLDVQPRHERNDAPDGSDDPVDALILE